SRGLVTDSQLEVPYDMPALKLIKRIGNRFPTDLVNSQIAGKAYQEDW
ncbi:hypothetical protein HMPREF9061_01686, partial [Actinomyces sp. oral taxon 181 str. F0379]